MTCNIIDETAARKPDLYLIQTMERIDKEYTEDQLFILQDIADEQRAAMEGGWDKDGAQEYLSDIAVKLMEKDHE